LFLNQRNFGDWGIGDWGLGIGDWELGTIPNPQSPIPQSPKSEKLFLTNFYFYLINKDF
jgi:hypothetical protein